MRVRPQLSTRRKRLALLAIGVIALTSCGTRLPDSQFNLSQANGVPGATQSTGPTTGPTTGTVGGGQANKGTKGTVATQGHTIKTGQGANHGKNGAGVSTGNLFAGACGAVSSSGNKASDTGV